MTIALVTLPRATKPGIVDGGGSCSFTWSGSAWTLTSDTCASGTATEPKRLDGSTLPGNYVGEVHSGTCNLPGDIPYSNKIYTLLQDPEGLVEKYIEQYHTQALSRLLCQNAAVVINRGNKTIIHNYELTPEPRINQLVIPTGATRWSYCLLLADDTLKDEIYTACDNGKTAMNLVFGTPIGDETESKNTITLTVWCLPPRRISPDTTDEEVINLWIIPVVDDRYWWQYRHVADLSAAIDFSLIDTAKLLQDELMDMTGGSYLNINPNATYSLLPSFALLNDYENLPIMIDTANIHAGQRLVVDIGNFNPYDGTYSAPDITTDIKNETRFATISGLDSVDTFKWNLGGLVGLPEATTQIGKPYLVAGGKSTIGTTPIVGPYASVPESVDIQTTEGVYVNKTAAAASATAYKFAVGGAAIWRTCYDEDPGDAIVTQINKDYYYQFSHQFDFTFAGVQPWQQGYFDDYMVLSQTWNPKNKDYDIYTRVCSRQPNLQGEWTQQGGSGVGERDCWATVDEVVCDLYGDTSKMYVLATVTWYTGKDCKSKIPGEDPYTGQIKVEQICDIFTAYYTAEQLIGKTIRATYMYPQAALGGAAVDPCKPKWLCDTVCGEPHCA